MHWRQEVLKLRLMLVINPNAGGGRAAAQVEPTVRILRELGVEFDMERTSGPGDATRIARAAAVSGYDVVASMGGDGTANEVVNGIADTSTALALVPVGTGNDFSAAIGLPKGDVAAACRAIARGRTRRVDLCRVNDRYFISSFGTGFDAAVTHLANRKYKKIGGIWAYIFSVLNVIWTYRPGPVHIVADGRGVTKPTLMVAVTNWRSIGGGMVICPDAAIDDGTMDMCIVDRVPIPRFLQCFPKVMKGTHTSMKEVHMLRASHVTINCSSPQPCHVDGEVFFADSLDLRIFPGAITVVVGEG